MNKIIKNTVALLGNFDSVQEIRRKINTEKSQIDFNGIKPMERDSSDILFDDYMNLCLNVYLKKNKENYDDLVSTFEFVGKTLEVPYEFRVLEDKELNSAKSKYQVKKLMEDAKKVVSKIEDKSIFNGYMKRDTFWGTGSGAYMPKVKDNKLEFLTFDKAPIALMVELSMQYPDIKIDYNYTIDGRITKMYIKQGYTNVVVDNNKDYEEPILYKLITENVKI